MSISKKRPTHKTVKKAKNKSAQEVSAVDVNKRNKPRGAYPIGAAQSTGKAIPLAAPAQAKVTVGAPGDRYEREADHVSDQVAAGRHVNAISRLPAGGLGAQRQSDDAGGDESTQTLTLQREPDGASSSGKEETPAQTKADDKTPMAQSQSDAGENGAAQTKCAKCAAEEKVQRRDDESRETQTKQETDTKGTEAAQTASTGNEESVQHKGAADKREKVQRSDAKPEEHGAAQTVQLQTEASAPSSSESGEGAAQTQTDGGEESGATENDSEGAGGGDEDATAKDCGSGEGGGGAEAGGEETESEPESERENAAPGGAGARSGGEDVGCGESGGGESETQAPGAGGQSCGGGNEPSGAGEAPAGAAGETSAAGGGATAAAAPAKQPASAGGGSVPSCATEVSGAGTPETSEAHAEGEQPASAGGGSGGGGSHGNCGTAQTKSEENAPPAAAQHSQEEGAQTKANEEHQKADDGNGDAQTKGATAPAADQQHGSTQTKPATGGAARDNEKGTIAGQAIRSRGAGEPLSPHVRERLENSLGVDLSEVRVHSDGHAHAANKGLRAKAFTHKNHIWLGSGQSQSDLKLMAHEVTHTVQQGSAERARPASSGRRVQPEEDRTQQRSADETTQNAEDNGNESGMAVSTADATQPVEGAVQRATASSAAAKKAAADTPAAPKEVVELKGRKNLDDLPDPVAAWLAQRPHRYKGAPVNVQYGGIAKGTVTLRKQGKHYYLTKRQSLPIRHPLFQRIGTAAPELVPRLYLYHRGTSIAGHVGLVKGDAYVAASRLRQTLLSNTDILGLAGLDLKLPTTTFLLKDGVLHIGPVTATVGLGKTFTGSVTIEATDETVTRFDGQVAVVVPGLANGTLLLKRNALGLTTGEVKLAVVLSERFSGNVLVAWDGSSFSGVGEVGYDSEKLSGKVTIKVMDEAKAKGLAAQKLAPPEQGAGETKPAQAAAPAKPAKNIHYVVFGDGTLNFAFTDWLNGAAQVIVDPVGHVTIIGKITPQAEVTLFKQYNLASYLPTIPRFEARASYGIPVIGNIYVAAGIGFTPFAFVGPGMLRRIEVSGTYSTDPAVNKDFAIQANLNIPAAAGISLTGMVKAGIVILDHDLSAGGTVTGTAGLKGYVDANPIIGYREKGQPGQDKKGEFFIRGDMEIAAQAFLGLSGSLFISLDSPWWSPAPDKTWTWPLGEKEWPLGRTFGINASMDYVLGSGQWPKVDFKPPEFSGDKFLSDIVDDNMDAKAGDQGKKPGKWKEKNSKAAEPPPKDAPPVPPKNPPVLAKGTSNKGKKTGSPVAGNGRTVDGKSVAELKAKALRNGKPPAKASPSPKGAKASETKKDIGKTTHDKKLAEGLAALGAVTRRYAETGATREEVAAGVKSVRRKFKIFKSIEIADGGQTWDYHYVASKGELKGPPKTKSGKTASQPGDTSPEQSAARELRAALSRPQGIGKKDLQKLIAAQRKRYRITVEHLQPKGKRKYILKIQKTHTETIPVHEVFIDETKSGRRQASLEPAGQRGDGARPHAILRHRASSLPTPTNSLTQAGYSVNTPLLRSIGTEAMDRPQWVKAEFLRWIPSKIARTSETSTETAKKGRYGKAEELLKGSDKSARWNGGHLIGNQFGGPGVQWNLVPMTAGLNQRAYLSAETWLRSEWNQLRRPGKTTNEHAKASVWVGVSGYSNTYTASKAEITKIPGIEEKSSKSGAENVTINGFVPTNVTMRVHFHGEGVQAREFTRPTQRSGTSFFSTYFNRPEDALNATEINKTDDVIMRIGDPVTSAPNAQLPPEQNTPREQRKVLRSNKTVFNFKQWKP